MTHLALLRGINVGGKAVLPMKELSAIFTAVGASNVRTYIQSGNVLFDSDAPEPVIEAVTKQIAAVYRYPGRIVLRSAAELVKAYKSNPFMTDSLASVDPLNVYFLADKPDAAAVKSLDPDRSPGDTFIVRGREIYLHLPQGMARTKLTNAYFDGKLKTVSTARNWKTVAALVKLVAGS